MPCLALLALSPLWMPANASLQGRAVDSQMAVSLASMAAVLLVAQAVLLRGLLRRGRSNARRFSIWNAAAFAGMTALLLLLAVRAETLWAANHFQGPSYDALQIEVVGQQFQWYFHYPGQDAAFGRTAPELVNAAAGNPLGLDPADPQAGDDIVASTLVLPVNREVNLRLRSLDVVHGLFIPAMRVKQNAVPGSTFDLHFTPTTLGTYDIVCSQVCGTGHYRMGAQLRVVSASDYAVWLAKHAPLSGNNNERPQP